MFYCSRSPGGTAFGQVATGVPPFSSNSGGSFDTVDNANLNVHFSIPIVAKAGRGLPFDYVLSFDSSIWSPLSPSGGPAWTPAANWGWGGATDGATGEVSYQTTPMTCYTQGDPPRPHTYYEYSDFAYHDASGTAHPFRILISNISSTVCNNNGPPSEQTASSFDGSGYIMTAHVGAWASVQAPNGDTILPPSSGQPGSGSIGDANGNQLSFTASGSSATFTDTLGVTALTVSGAGTPASPIVYAYPNPSGGMSQVTVNYTAYTVGTSFGCSGVSEFKSAAENLVSSIVLADGTSYTFTYDSAGRITSVTLPTGGTIHYAYSGGYNGITCSDGSTATLTRQTPDGTWTYTHTASGSNWTTTVTDPQNNQTAYQFQGIYETERQIYQGSTSGTLLETVDTCYNGSSSPCTGTAVNLPITARQVTVTLPGVALAKTVTDYNSYGLPKETDVYDYGLALVSKTIITYASPGNNIQERPASITVENASSTPVAESSYSYDSKGNLLTLTETTQGSSTIQRSFTYGAGGVLLSATDFSGNPTTFTYGDCNNSFPTSIAQPLSLTSSVAWDCNTGLVTSVTDPNSQPTGFSYDELYRLTQTNYPDGGQVSTAYNDTSSPVSVVTATKLTSSQNRVDTTVLDGLGRTSQAQLNSDLAGTDYVNTTYDSLGRAASVTNPYRGSPNGSTSYAYDALGRLTSVTYADGSEATTGYSGNCATSTDAARKARELCANALGEVTKVIEDPGGLNFETDYSYDALGNLVSVNDGGQTRSYTYDMLSRLISATTPESGTTTYTYSGCSGDPSNVCTRTDARNITTTYTYDALNRLTSKAYSNDPNHTPTARYYYDSPPPGLVGWPGTLSNEVGRLAGTCTVPAGNTQCSGYSTATVNTYDPIGRVASYAQCTPYNCGTSFWFMTYNYDLAGDVASWTHPAGFTITNTINTAQEITQITSSLVDATHPQYLAKSITYTPWGAEQKLENGCTSSSGQEQGCTDTLETYVYNNRMQPVMIELGNTSNASADYCLVYNYYPNVANPTGCAVPAQSTDDNGSVMGVFDQDNVNPSLSHTETYAYDALSRLSTAVATGNSTYNLTYTYDRYGNMTCTINGQTQGLCPNYSFNPANNEITTSGFAYDAAGDLTDDGTYTYQWDAEGRMSSMGGNATRSYAYDAFEDKVETTNSTNEDPAAFIWDPFGKRVGTYSLDMREWGNGYVWLDGRLLSTDRQGQETTWFFHVNNLSSVDFMTSVSGGVQQDNTYYPWGQTWQNTFSDWQAYYAGMMQSDSVTGLKYTPRRWYNPPLGRWLSPDPLGGDITNPQSLNRYAYVLDNPTTLIDPLGLDSCWNHGSYEGSGSPPPCSYGAPVSYTLDGSDVPSSVANGALQGGFSVGCPGGDCSGLIAQQGPNGTTSFAQLSFGPIGNTIAYGTSPGGLWTAFDSIFYGYAYRFIGTVSDNSLPGPSAVGPIFGSGAGNRAPQVPSPAAASPPSRWKSIACTVTQANKDLSQLVLIEGAMDPLESRIVPAGGMVVAGGGVAFGAGAAIATFWPSVFVAGPVALAGAGLAAEGVYYGITGRLYVPASCH